MKTPGYYAVIPADIRYDEELPANAKLLYGEISAMAAAAGFCWARNSYFASLYHRDKTTISRWLRMLERRGYIRREMQWGEDRTAAQRRIYLTGHGGMQSCTGDSLQKYQNLHGKNAKENNTENNTRESMRAKNPYGKMQNVWLDDREVEDLLRNYTQEEVEAAINRLSLYMESRGREYRNHYATLLQWLESDCAQPAVRVVEVEEY